MRQVRPVEWCRPRSTRSSSIRPRSGPGINSAWPIAVIRNFEVIGEASNNIEKHYPEFVVEHPELPLASAYQMLNPVAHGYFKVDFEIVWRTVCNDLPDLYKAVKAVSI